MSPVVVLKRMLVRGDLIQFSIGIGIQWRPEDELWEMFRVNELILSMFRVVTSDTTVSKTGMIDGNIINGVQSSASGWSCISLRILSSDFARASKFLLDSQYPYILRSFQTSIHENLIMNDSYGDHLVNTCFIHSFIYFCNVKVIY